MFCDLMKQNLNEECLVHVIGLNEGVKARVTSALQICSGSASVGFSRAQTTLSLF